MRTNQGLPAPNEASVKRSRSPASDTELTQMVVEVLIRQRSPFRWS
jgi:hypothetical protein